MIGTLVAAMLVLTKLVRSANSPEAAAALSAALTPSHAARSGAALQLHRPDLAKGRRGSSVGSSQRHVCAPRARRTDAASVRGSRRRADRARGGIRHPSCRRHGRHATLLLRVASPVIADDAGNAGTQVDRVLRLFYCRTWHSGIPGASRSASDRHPRRRFEVRGQQTYNKLRRPAKGESARVRVDQAT